MNEDKALEEKAAEAPEITLTPELIEKIRAEQKAKRERDRKRVLDPNDPFYLAGFLAFGPDEFEAYTPEWARKAGKRCVYHIRPFSRQTVLELNKSFKADGNRAAELKGLKEGALIGWERETFKGVEIPFSVEEIENIPELDFSAIAGRCYAYATGILPEEAEGLG
jgi:hypothetical protein